MFLTAAQKREGGVNPQNIFLTDLENSCSYDSFLGWSKGLSFLLADNKDVSVMMSEMDVNAIAGTLKLYFRELPEPLFTDELYPNFAEGIGT